MPSYTATVETTIECNASASNPGTINDHVDSMNDQANHHQDGYNAAAKVFGITELLEQILLQADDHALRTTLPKVSRGFQQTILGSIKLQRRLHSAPDWTQPRLLPAPIPASMLSLKARKDSTSDEAQTTPIDHCSEVPQQVFDARFDRDALAWVCNLSSSTNGAFRNMLICQPPVTAVEIYCWSNTVDYRAKLVEKHIESESGVTCGQVWDLIKVSEPIGGIAKLTWLFERRSTWSE